MVPEPIKDNRQLSLTIYRLTHGCSFIVLQDMFGVSKPLAAKTFNKVVKSIVLDLYDDFVVLPASEDE